MYIRYILSLVKSQKMKLTGAEYKIPLNTVSKKQPQIRYILGDMIPPN